MFYSGSSEISQQQMINLKLLIISIIFQSWFSCFLNSWDKISMELNGHFINSFHVNPLAVCGGSGSWQ